MQQHIEKWQHLSREEQKILAEVWGLVQNDDQEVHYEMLKLNAPDEVSGEFWFRMAETLSTLPPNRSLDLRMNGGRLSTAVSILSVMIEDNPDIPSFGRKKLPPSIIWYTDTKPVPTVWYNSPTKRQKPTRRNT